MSNELKVLKYTRHFLNSANIPHSVVKPKLRYVLMSVWESFVDVKYMYTYSYALKIFQINLLELFFFRLFFIFFRYNWNTDEI